MFEALETYLRETGRYLAGTDGAAEILEEIRSHILEKAETEYGEVNEATIRKALAAYGTPREVAEPYLETGQIIAPVYRRHFFRYLWALFGFHLVITAIALALHADLFVLPFIYVPAMTVPAALLYVPMALVYDFGLVALFFFLMTRWQASFRLPWPEAVRSGALRRPRPAVLAVLAGVLAVSLYLLLRFHTVFLYSVNLHRPVPFLDPASSFIYSCIFVAAIAVETCCYAIRFAMNSPSILLMRDVAVLALLWAGWNVIIRPHSWSLPVVGARHAVVLALVLLLALILVRFLRDLVRVTRSGPLGRHP
jgi:hypothetical protein